MPTWGDRMSTSDIQAIVGFIRQWEATAPEVATLARGGGGPPWRNNTTTNTSLFGVLPATNTTTTQGSQVSQVLDWRVLLLAGVVLAIAFTLISSGFSALKKKE